MAQPHRVDIPGVPGDMLSEDSDFDQLSPHYKYLREGRQQSQLHSNLLLTLDQRHHDDPAACVLGQERGQSVPD